MAGSRRREPPSVPKGGHQIIERTEAIEVAHRNAENPIRAQAEPIIAGFDPCAAARRSVA